MCCTLRLALPLFKSDQIEKRARKNFHIFFCTILKEKWFHVNELLKRFHLNDHTIGFHPQTQKLELQTKQVSCENTAEEVSFERSNHRNSSADSKLELCTKQIVPCATTAEEASFEWSNHRISSTVRLKSYKNITSRHA